MPDDFSVAEEEEDLAHWYFTLKSEPYFSINEPWEIEFAQRRLVEQVIWRFMYDSYDDRYYCHLDGFTTDWCYDFGCAFIRAGSIQHLPEPGTPGDIPIILGIEFNRLKVKLKRAIILFGDEHSNAYAVQRQQYDSFDEFFRDSQNLGDNWEVGFFRDHTGWKKALEFDLTFLLMKESLDSNLTR